MKHLAKAMKVPCETGDLTKPPWHRYRRAFLEGPPRPAYPGGEFQACACPEGECRHDRPRIERLSLDARPKKADQGTPGRA